MQSKFLIVLICLLLVFPIISFCEDENQGVPFSNSDYSGFEEMNVTSFWLVGQTASPLAVAVNTINTALLFLGLTSAGFIIYGGLIWFFARDNDEQAKKAMDIIKGATIGLILVLLSFSISYIIWTMFIYSTFSY